MWPSTSADSCCGACLYCNVHNLLYGPSLGDVFPARVNDSKIIRNSMSRGDKGMSGVLQQSRECCDLQDSP